MTNLRKSSAKSLSQSYNKLAQKLEHSIKTGHFQRWSLNKRQYLIARLLDLLRRLKSAGVKVAYVSSIAILSTLSLQGQFIFNEPFDELCGDEPWEGQTFTPFPDNGEFLSRQVLSGDLDNDDDEDFIVITNVDGEYSAQYFENTGAGIVELTGEDNPLNSFNMLFEEGSLPPVFTFSLGDATLNGRLDLVFGEFKGEIVCFENTEGGFVEFEESKDIENAEPSDFASVSFANIDDDCEDEIVSIENFVLGNGEEARLVKVFDYQNGSYVESPLMVDMFVEIENNDSETLYPYFFDINGDGIDELLTVSLKDGDFEGVEADLYFKDELGIYERVSDFENPFTNEFGEIVFADEEFNGAYLPIFDFGDVDGDGNLNMYVGFKSLEDNSEDLPLMCFDTEITIAPGIPCRIDPASGAVPTLGQWGLIILGLLTMIFGIVGLKQQSAVGRVKSRSEQK